MRDDTHTKPKHARILKGQMRYSVKPLFIVCLSVMMSVSVRAEIDFPDVQSFNRSLKNGAELTKTTYKAKLGHVLNEGSIPPDIKGDWNDRSALTSGLFPIPAKQNIQLSFMCKTAADAKNLPSLWYEVRYYDAHGVFSESGGGELKRIETTWEKVIFNAQPPTSAMKYAEVWFVKYKDEMPDALVQEIEAEKAREQKIEAHLVETKQEETPEEVSAREERGRNALLKKYTPENIKAMSHPIYISDVSIL